MQGTAESDHDAFKLMLIVKSYAELRDVNRTRQYLSKLKALPDSIYRQDKQFDAFVEAYILDGESRHAEAFDALSQYTDAMLIAAEDRRVASVKGMYEQLRKELDSKTEESRLLAKQVQMRNLLLTAAGVIALLLTVIVTGGAFWVMRMRRLHTSLNEAHEHAEAANAAKSRFLAVMSHELRTPLNGVLGMAQTLKASDLNDSQLEQVDILVDSGKTLMALLNDVLDMSRIEAGKVELAPSPASLKDTVERVINTYSPLASDKNIGLRYDLDESAEPVMLFDVLRVYQCLSNLVSNAVKFTEKGSVRIRVSAELRKGGGYVVRCEVRDTGIGMTKSVMDRLFEAYSQADAMTARRYGGSGLGLSISRRLAELMGGSISVSSQEGEGSTFIMTFKAEEVLQEAPHAIETSAVILAEEDESLPGLHILLVDDHPVNRKVARLFLEPFGFIITEAADGQEALDLDMSRFDLVLMDLNMPKLGGLEATRIFRATESAERHLPIIALTADAMKDQVEACYAAGMDAHLAKPIVMDVLIDTVARLLHLHDQDKAEVA